MINVTNYCMKRIALLVLRYLMERLQCHIEKACTLEQNPQFEIIMGKRNILL